MQEPAFRPAFGYAGEIGDDWLMQQREGDAAMAIGKLEESREHFSRALLISRNFKNTDPRVLITLAKLTEIHEQMLDYETAAFYVKKALAIQILIFGATTKPVLENVQKLVLLYSLMGYWNEAERHAANSIRIQEGLKLTVAENEAIRAAEQQSTTMVQFVELPPTTIRKQQIKKIAGSAIATELRRCVRKALKVAFPAMSQHQAEDNG